jgi:hypothetical protein
MTKKQSTAIANILGKHLAEKQHSPIEEYEAVESLSLDLAKYFSEKNPLFDEDSFLEAVFAHTPNIPIGSYK